MKRTGRWLQILALILLPVAVVLEISGGLGRPFGVAELLLMLLFGFSAFWLGRLMEGYATPPEGKGRDVT